MSSASNDEAGRFAAEDITVLLYPARVALFAAMPAATRACWRLVNKRTRDDVFDACTRLRWREPAMLRYNMLPKGVTLQSQPQPHLLPVALMAKLPVLRQLLCHDLDTLTTLEGLPAGLDVLQLSGTATCSIVDFAAMAGCSRLLALDLHDGSLGSAKASQVATQGMHGLSCLRDLNLAECYLGPGGMANLAPGIHALSQLTQLVMSLSDSAPGDVAAIAPIMADLTCLQHLCLEDNGFQPNGMAAMGLALPRLSNLRILGLRGTFLGLAGARDLCPALGTLANLQWLDLSANALGPAGAAVFADALRNLTNLTYLSLNTNRMGHGYGPASLRPSLQMLTRLKTLDISCNMLNATGLAHLVPALQALPLVSLNLGFNAFGPEGAEVLAPLVEQLGRRGLRELDIRGNDLGPQGMAHLAPSLSCLTDLRMFDLGGNTLDAAATAVLAPALKTLTRVTELGFARNIIGSKGMLHLCDALPQLPQLRVLDLCGSELGAEEGVHELLALLPQLEWLGVRTTGRWIALRPGSAHGRDETSQRLSMPRRHQHPDGRSSCRCQDARPIVQHAP